MPRDVASISLPEALLPVSVREAGRVVPLYLHEHDLPWLRRLVATARSFADCSQGDAKRGLRVPLPGVRSALQQAAAVRVILGLCRSHHGAPIGPKAARAAVFSTAAASDEPRSVIMERVAALLGVTPEQLERSLFADLPGQRLIGNLPEDLLPHQLALRTNLAIAQGLVMRSTRLVLELEGGSRAVVRQAKLGGLICTILGSQEKPRIEVSGPFALFRQTILYGRALATLVPLLAWCAQFHLRADCVLRGERLRLELSTGDPLFPAQEPRLFDSRLEERFAHDLARLAPDWEALREPEPIRAGDALVFPDFSLQHRSGGPRWLIEILGFWTPEYLERKLALYRAARAAYLILCIDVGRSCAPGDLPAGARVVWFRRRVDAKEILAIVGAAI